MSQTLTQRQSRLRLSVTSLMCRVNLDSVAKAFDVVTTNNRNYKKKKTHCAFHPEMLGMILVGAR